MASLFVIQGADQGKRFELSARPMALGRDNSNPIRLHDNEVSRRHAEVRPIDEESYKVVDLGSANGTHVNGQQVDQAPLRPGDHLRLGKTVMLYSEGPGQQDRELTRRVDLLAKASPEDRSAIVRSIPAGDGSRVLDAPGPAGEWLKVRLANLGVMYQATQAISHILDLDALMPQILRLVFDSIGADRGAILLADEDANLTPKAVRWRAELGPRGRYVVLEKKFGSPSLVDDGVTIAKEIEVEDKFENMGAQLVREVASKTNDVAGDGTTTATVLAQAIVREGLKNVAAGSNPLAVKKWH